MQADLSPELGSETFLRDAAAYRVLFARVRGYPAWPVSYHLHVCLQLMRAGGSA